jgi:flagellar basal body-associated protein FliL
VKKKLKLIAPVLVLLLGGAGGAYKFVLSPGEAKAKEPKPKIEGHLFPVPGEFVVNLAGGHYGKVTVALLLEHPPVAAGGGHGGEEVDLEQGPMVRAIITDQLTGLSQEELIDRHGRHEVLKAILKELHRSTDVEVEEVLFTDVGVQ